MKDICGRAVAGFLERLRNSFAFEQSEDGCLLVTPFVRSDNEAIELELTERADGKILIVDNCETIDYLTVNGLNVVRSRDLRRRVEQICRRYGVDFSRDEILKVADAESLGDAVFSVLAAAQEVSYLIYKKLRRPPSAFDEEVERFLISHEIRYDPKFSMGGASTEHTFRFHVNGRLHALLEPLTSTSSHAAEVKAKVLAFKWVDISQLWPQYARIAIIDDVGPKAEYWGPTPRSILERYSTKLVPWSRNEALLEVVSHSGL